jgi:hypothetical protein
VTRVQALLLTFFALLGVVVATAVAALDGDSGPPAPERADRGCDLAAADTLTLPACRTVASDTGKGSPVPFWGRVDCVSPTRESSRAPGGDPGPAANGEAQGDGAFRRLRVLDGDVISSGERCELGRNDRRRGTTVFYREGSRRITFASLRIPPEWDLTDPNWRVALQMKQVQPYDAPDLASMLELQVREGRWMLISSWEDLWSGPATPGVWTRFAFDVTYSSDPDAGRVTVYADLNGDGDSADEDERSETIEHETLREETPGISGPPDEAPIPSHLRAGLYQNRVFACPPPAGCWMDVDNVQIMAPSPPPG